MRRPFVLLGAALIATVAPERSRAQDDLPPPAKIAIDFETHIRPIVQEHCLKCHGRGKYKGGLSLETREDLLQGGEGGPAAVVNKSGESLLIELVAGLDPVRRMPEKGEPLSAEQIGLLRAWIDQGLRWPEGLSLGFRRAPLAPRRPEVPPAPGGLALANPIDRFIAAYAARANVTLDWSPVSDRVFARRAALDLIGLPPKPERLEAFVNDPAPDKRARYIDELLDDDRAYADHWLTFWNDLLRNAYRGTGFIDGGRTSITRWLYQSLYENKPYDQFVHELIAPVAGSEGFTKGIIWRGVVNASQVPPVQAAQNLSQVFLGTNLKCASCHDSFVNRWKLADAYALANVFAEKPLEVHRCDKPTGKTAGMGFIYPELGSIDAAAPRAERMNQLADILVKPANGRFSRTIVNRLWAQLMGRGLVEPLDDLDQAPWDQDLLDWLASEFVAQGHDVRKALGLIVGSRAYQMAAVGLPEPSDLEEYVFRGPLTKRMTAEQFLDAIATVTGSWPRVTGEMLRVDGRGQGGQVVAVRAAIAAEAREAGAGDPKAPKVAAEWVWGHADAEKDPGGRILLRKVFTIDALPKRAIALATCDNELELFINGEKVAHSTNWSVPIGVDVTRHLRVGENVIAADATNWPDPKHGRGTQVANEPNPAAFIAWVGGLDEERNVLWGIGTDETWLLTAEAAGSWAGLGFDTTGWGHAVVLPLARRTYPRVDLGATLLETTSGGAQVRAALTFDDPLLTALGRTNREQVVTRRDSIATTLQALELTNGTTLDTTLKTGARLWKERLGNDPKALAQEVFHAAIGRAPNADELAIAQELVGDPASDDGIQDLLWTVFMLPEFQLIR